MQVGKNTKSFTNRCVEQFSVSKLIEDQLLLHIFNICNVAVMISILYVVIILYK